MARPPLLDHAFGYMPAQIVYAAASIGLGDALGGAARTSEELAKDTGTHAPSLYRLLRALAALGVVVQVDEDLFELSPAGAGLRGDPGPDGGASFRDLIRLFCSPEVWRSWGDLVGTLRTGEVAWERVTGRSSFEYMAANPEMSAIFNGAMSEHTRQVAPEIIAAHDFTRYGVIADLGGGDGTLLAAILSAAPRSRGILFDLPAGLEDATRTLEAAGVADRCRTVPGDFFEDVPADADAYLLKSVIHDWDDERSVAILGTVRRAMRPDARVLLVEFVPPPIITPDNAGNIMSDINMLVATGGRERTERDFDTLLAAAGLRRTALAGPMPSGYHVIEAAPADAP